MTNKAYLHDPKGLGIRGNCHTNALARPMRAGDLCGATREPIAANSSICTTAICDRSSYGRRFLSSDMGGLPAAGYFFGCVIAPVTEARGAFLRLGLAVKTK